jgi:hypothetical protein
MAVKAWKTSSTRYSQWAERGVSRRGVNTRSGAIPFVSLEASLSLAKKNGAAQPLSTRDRPSERSTCVLASTHLHNYRCPLGEPRPASPRAMQFFLVVFALEGSCTKKFPSQVKMGDNLTSNKIPVWLDVDTGN